MNVNDQWMLEKMQQMAANMAASLPQAGQNADTPEAGKGGTFKDMMDKAKDQKLEAPKKSDPAQKKEPVQSREPVQKKEPGQNTEGKTAVSMSDPRIQAMPPETQAQIAAGFLTPVETPNGTLLLRVDAEPTAIVMPLLPNGMRDPSKPITLVNSDGEQFEVYLDLENGEHKLFQLTDDGGKKQIDLFPEQPKLDLLSSPKNLDMTVVTREGKVTTLREAMAEFDGQDDADTDLDVSAMADRQPLFKDVKAAPIKVGDNFQLDTQQPDMEAKLAESIRFAAQQGLRQIEIRLSPENLGALTIRLTQSADGTLQVLLRTSTVKAANLLSQHTDGLNAALQGFGQNEVRVEVQRGEDSQQAQQQQQQQTDPDGHNRQSQQQQQRSQEESHSGDFLQKLRLGLFGTEDM